MKISGIKSFKLCSVIVVMMYAMASMEVTILSGTELLTV